jgi:methyltransferase-like protein/2-polyprenyl-3-methyl-5-hydroxy-6-metoxy-1,4-benzoquinol methylase
MARSRGEAVVNAYDAVPYPSYPLPQTHPDRLATLATLLGMKPARVNCCRVLELGCGSGGNLIPMAFCLPQSEFVGIDLAARPLAAGQAMVDALALKNITLRRLDIMDVAPDLGEFDYIITHGLYSWVPPPAQDKILAISKAHLAPHGVAYVSYNTLPGYHLQGMVRDMMRFHARQFRDPEERVTQALALVKFLAESQTKSDAYGTFLRQAFDDLHQRSRAGTYHDELAEVNSPVYFYQFIEHATRHGLQFLSEANVFEMQERAFPPPVAEALGLLSADEIVLKEQYLDFLRCRRFRQTLLCHRDVSLDRALKPERVWDFSAASSARPVSPAPEITSPSVEEFRGPLGSSMSTGHPLAKAAICELATAWPRSLHFNDALARVRSRLHPGDPPNAACVDGDPVALGTILLQAYTAGLVELHVYPPQFASEVSERPVASPLARLQLRTGTQVSCLRHTRINVEGALERQFLLLLDGSRDRATLVRDLAALVASGEVTLERDGAPVRDGHTASRILAEELEPALVKLARLTLLVA